MKDPNITTEGTRVGSRSITLTDGFKDTTVQIFEYPRGEFGISCVDTYVDDELSIHIDNPDVCRIFRQLIDTFTGQDSRGHNFPAHVINLTDYKRLDGDPVSPFPNKIEIHQNGGATTMWKSNAFSDENDTTYNTLVECFDAHNLWAKHVINHLIENHDVVGAKLVDRLTRPAGDQPGVLEKFIAEST